MAEKKTVKDLLEDEIKDLYSAEKQLTKAIPKMAKGSHDAALAAAFKNHLKETERQVARLEEVGTLLDIKPSGKKCEGMEGVIKEGAEALAEDGDETILDLGIIGAGEEPVLDERRIRIEQAPDPLPRHQLVLSGELVSMSLRATRARPIEPGGDGLRRVGVGRGVSQRSSAP